MPKNWPNADSTICCDTTRQYKDPETGKEPTNEKEFALYALKFATQNLWDPAKYKGGDKFSGWEEFSQDRCLEFGPVSLPQALGQDENQDRHVRVLQRNPEGGPGKACRKAQHHRRSTSWRSAFTRPGVNRRLFPIMKNLTRPGIQRNIRSSSSITNPRLNREGRSANCTWYYDFKDLDPGDETWDDVAKINPLDGKKLGINNGDRIRLTSPTGNIECTAKLWEGVRPGTVAKCYGQGHWAYGRLAAKEFGKVPRGGNNNDLIPAVYDRLSGSTVRHAGTRVKIEKI